MTAIKVISFVLLIFGCFNIIHSDRYYRIKYVKCNLTDVASNYSCSVENNTVSGHIFLTSVIDRKKEKRISLHAKGFKFVNNQWQTWLIDVVVDVCDVLDFIFKPNLNVYIDIIRPEIKKFSNLNHACPYGPNELVYTKKLNGDRLFNLKQIYFMKGLYKLEGKAFLTEFGKLVATITAEVEVKTKLKSRKNKG